MIDKIYYWDDDSKDVKVTFAITSEEGELMDQFDSYTKAERKICEILERDNA